MNSDNVFDLLIYVLFTMITQLGGLGHKVQDLVISFRLGKVKTLPQLHLRALQTRSDFFLLQDDTVQINNLTGKYIMELSKLKYLQWYITTFELDYRNFESLPQIHQLYTIFNSTIEKVFETLETSDLYMSKSHSII